MFAKFRLHSLSVDVIILQRYMPTPLNSLVDMWNNDLERFESRVECFPAYNDLITTVIYMTMTRHEGSFPTVILISGS